MFLCDCYCQKTKNKNKFEDLNWKIPWLHQGIDENSTCPLENLIFWISSQVSAFLDPSKISVRVTRYFWLSWETNFSILIIVIVKGSSKLEFWIRFYFEIENCQISWEWIDFFEWTPPAWGWASRTPPPTPPWWTRPSRSTSRPWPCSRCWSTVVQVIIQKAHPRIIIARAPLL